MFKLVVLFSTLALARGSGLTYASAVIAPATTTISKQYSSVVHPSPLTYHYAASIASPHYLKKRSASFIGTYSYCSPLYSTPLLHSAGLLQSATLWHSAPTYSHYLKKRSVAPLAYSFNPTAYSTSSPRPLFHSAPLIHSQPLINSPPHIQASPSGHYLRKRSVAPLAYASIIPTSYSHQSRTDLHFTPLISHTRYAAPVISHASSPAPITYTTHLPYSHNIY